MRTSIFSFALAATGLTSAASLPPRHQQETSVQSDGHTVNATLLTGDSVTVYLHGATITSWIPSGDKEDRLLLSTNSSLDGSAALRGGIPVVFPNFGSPAVNSSAVGLPGHGFARNSTWTLRESHKADDMSSVSLIFQLKSGDLIEKYRRAWNYTVTLTYNVTLTQNNMRATFAVENEDQRDLDFQALLHSYLKTPDIALTTVTGLQNATYQDKTQNYTRRVETDPSLRITGEVDRIYTVPDVAAPISLNFKCEPRTQITRSATFPDVTVWNIGSANILKASYADFTPKDAWQHYLAIEPGAVAQWPGATVRAGERWEAYVQYKAAGF